LTEGDEKKMKRQSELANRGLGESFLLGFAQVLGWALPIVASSLLVLWVHQLGHTQQKEFDLQGK
jgi:hypothetical protein